MLVDELLKTHQPQKIAFDLNAFETMRDNFPSRIRRYRMSHRSLRGEGERLGTAYRLKNGEVIYVPDH
jgi:hypothetical protein